MIGEGTPAELGSFSVIPEKLPNNFWESLSSLLIKMESELKQRVDEYVQANSVKVAPTTQKKEPAKAPKAPKKAEKQPKEAKENAPKEIVEAPKDAPSEKKEVVGHYACACHPHRRRRSIPGRSKRERAGLTMTS